MMGTSRKRLGKMIGNGVGSGSKSRSQQGVHWMVINWYIQKNGINQYRKTNSETWSHRS